MGPEIDQQIALILSGKLARRSARGQQPIIQFDIGRFQVIEKQRVDPRQPAPLIQILEPQTPPAEPFRENCRIIYNHPGCPPIGQCPRRVPFRRMSRKSMPLDDGRSDRREPGIALSVG